MEYSSLQPSSLLQELTCHMHHTVLPATWQRWHSLPLPQPVTAGTQFSNPRGMQSWLHSQTVTYPSTNWARYSITSLMWQTVLSLCQTINKWLFLLLLLKDCFSLCTDKVYCMVKHRGLEVVVNAVMCSEHGTMLSGPPWSAGQEDGSVL